MVDALDGPGKGLVGVRIGGDALAIDRTVERGINRRKKKGKQEKEREGGESRHCGGGVREAEGEKGRLGGNLQEEGIFNLQLATLKVWLGYGLL